MLCPICPKCGAFPEEVSHECEHRQRPVRCGNPMVIEREVILEHLYFMCEECYCFFHFYRNPGEKHYKEYQNGPENILQYREKADHDSL